MDTICSIRQLGKLDAFHSLKGKFHAHLTVKADHCEINDLESLCKSLRTKLTVIDLHDFNGRKQSDVMLTCYFRDNEDGAVLRFANRLADYTNELESHGFQVIRAKIEHESLPSISPFSQTNYHEVHFKLRICESQFDEVYQQLKNLAPMHGFVPSQNPYKRLEGAVIQFLNLRIYEGGLLEANQKVTDIQQLLETLDLHLVETKRETIVFDTFQKLDQWWI